VTGASSLVSGFLARAGESGVAARDAAGIATYGDVVDRAERVAASLLQLEGRASLERERVALLVAPGADFVAAFFGVLIAGGVVVVLSPLHPAPETRYFCEDAGVRVVIVSDELSQHAECLAHDHRLLGVKSCTGGSARAGTRTLPAAEHPALQLYTSGTTGKPKGAVITHANLATQQQLLASAWGWTSRDVLLHTLPLHHMHGLAIAWLSAVGVGAATRFMPSFDARATWEALAECSVLMAVPTIHARLMAAFDAADPGTQARWAGAARRLRLVTSGSAALPVRLGERWTALTGSYPLERFGMTEIGVGTTNPLDGARRRPGSVGLPLPTVQTRVEGDELWVAGPSVFLEYHGRPEATREAFVTTETASATRWFKTGDTVTRDPDGYVRILGRTSVDILKSGGYKLSALEIEEVLREHPAVAEVAVVGLPDEAWGERVVACVVARSGREGECSEDALRGFAKERLAPYKVPKTVIVMTELPRNAVGKVLKPVLVKAIG
jgi:malonyl-CoA/methylmalonyl-CoA synthetase